MVSSRIVGRERRVDIAMSDVSSADYERMLRGLVGVIKLASVSDTSFLGDDTIFSACMVLEELLPDEDFLDKIV
jgi:hypothetical protein